MAPRRIDWRSTADEFDSLHPSPSTEEALISRFCAWNGWSAYAGGCPASRVVQARGARQSSICLTIGADQFKRGGLKAGKRIHRIAAAGSMELAPTNCGKRQSLPFCARMGRCLGRIGSCVGGTLALAFNEIGAAVQGSLGNGSRGEQQAADHGRSGEILHPCTRPPEVSLER